MTFQSMVSLVERAKHLVWSATAAEPDGLLEAAMELAREAEKDRYTYREKTLLYMVAGFYMSFAKERQVEK